MENIKNAVNYHIERSWPEELYQALSQTPEDEGYSLDLTKRHVGKHRHEPVIARVLQEAARKGRREIVKLILDDDVHPDIRIKKGDPAAIDEAHKSVRKLLYDRGAKVVTPSCSLHWRGLKTQTDLVDDTQSQSALLKPNQPYGDKDDRGVICRVSSSTEAQHPNSNTEEGDSSSTEAQHTSSNVEGDSGEKIFIIHPTVDEMIKTRGIDSLVTKKTGSFRWIHLPRNDVS
jgi:hypothetical protein